MRKGNIILARTILISGLSVLISYMINFFLTPYVTEQIGIEAYGFVTLAKTTVNYATIITTALTTFIIRYISVSYHEGKIQLARSYYSSSIVACIVIGLVILTISGIAIWNLEKLLIIPIEMTSSVKKLFFVVFITFFITTITTPVSIGAYLKNKLDVSAGIKITAHLFDATVMFACFSFFEPKVWFVSIGSFAAACITFIGNAILTKRTVPEVAFQTQLVSLQRVKDLVRNGIWNSLNQLGNVLNSGLDLIISNLLLSGVETGQIAVAKTIGAMFSTLYQVLFQPFQPQLLKSYAQEDKTEFYRELTKAMKICGCFSNIAFAGFASLGHLYFKLWLPSQDAGMLYNLTFITVLLSVTAGVMHPVYYVYTLTLKNKIPCWLTIVSGFVNVGAMYLLLKYTNIGPIAVVLTTTVIMLCMNLFFNPTYAAWCLGIRPQIFYSVICKHVVSAMTMLVLFMGVEKLILPEQWISLIMSALVMVCIGVVVHGLIMFGSSLSMNIIKRGIRKLVKK